MLLYVHQERGPRTAGRTARKSGTARRGGQTDRQENLRVHCFRLTSHRCGNALAQAARTGRSNADGLSGSSAFFVVAGLKVRRSQVIDRSSVDSTHCRDGGRIEIVAAETMADPDDRLVGYLRLEYRRATIPYIALIRVREA